jgi:hypothetical protein
MNELFQLRPVLLIQAGNVVSVDVGEVGFNHGNCPIFLQGPAAKVVSQFARLNRHQDIDIAVFNFGSSCSEWRWPTTIGRLGI